MEHSKRESLGSLATEPYCPSFPPHQSVVALGDRQHASNDAPTPESMVVVFHISDPRRRTVLCRLLRGFGEQAHRSVFVCWCDAQRKRRLQNLIEQFAQASHNGKEWIACRSSDACEVFNEATWMTSTTH